MAHSCMVQMSFLEEGTSSCRIFIIPDDFTFSQIFLVNHVYWVSVFPFHFCVVLTEYLSLKLYD
jgi:uncharacterized membrane protein YagU involved in acid resistance